jgi:hypothetical protein
VVTVATTSALAAIAPARSRCSPRPPRELAADVQGEARRYLDDLALTGELVARQGDPYTGKWPVTVVP